MPYNIKAFQERYSLANKDIAQICKCSLPTIQKWRSGEVPVSGAAEQLMRLLDISAEGSSNALRETLMRISQASESPVPATGAGADSYGNKSSAAAEQLEYMLESRRKDLELARSEARYLSMVDSFNNPVCRWLPDTTLTFVNPAYARLFAQEGEDIVGNKWIEFLPEDIRASTEVLVSDLVRRGEEESSTHEVHTVDGDLAYFEWQDIPVKDASGKVVELHSIGFDVTELVKLRNIKDECSLTRNALFDLFPNAMAVINSEGRFLDVNDVFRMEVSGDKPIMGMSDLLSGPAFGRMKRLLRRIRPREAFNYQLKIKDKAYRMSGRLIAEDKVQGSQFVAKFEEISGLQNQITQLRLGTEYLVDGSKLELNWRQPTIDHLKDRMNQLGNRADVDRVFVFIIDHEQNVFNNILEWTAKGVQSSIDDLQRFPLENYPWWMERILKNQWIKFEDTSKMPRGAVLERELLVAQGVRSIICAPLAVNDNVIGWVGFNHNHTQRIWHAQDQKLLEDFKQEFEELVARETG